MEELKLEPDTVLRDAGIPSGIPTAAPHACPVIVFLHHLFHGGGSLDKGMHYSCLNTLTVIINLIIVILVILLVIF